MNTRPPKLLPLRVHAVPMGRPVYWCPRCQSTYPAGHECFDFTVQATLHVYRQEDL